MGVNQPPGQLLHDTTTAKFDDTGKYSVPTYLPIDDYTALRTPSYSEELFRNIHSTFQTISSDSILAGESDDLPDDLLSSNSTELPPNMQFNSSHVLQISCYSAIIVVSLVGNLCVLRAILSVSKRQRKSRVNFMLMHLCIADLIVSTHISLVRKNNVTTQSFGKWSYRYLLSNSAMFVKSFYTANYKFKID